MGHSSAIQHCGTSLNGTPSRALHRLVIHGGYANYLTAAKAYLLPAGLLAQQIASLLYAGSSATGRDGPSSRPPTRSASGVRRLSAPAARHGQTLNSKHLEPQLVMPRQRNIDAD